MSGLPLYCCQHFSEGSNPVTAVRIVVGVAAHGGFKQMKSVDRSSRVRGGMAHSILFFVITRALQSTGSVLCLCAIKLVLWVLSLSLVRIMVSFFQSRPPRREENRGFRHMKCPECDSRYKRCDIRNTLTTNASVDMLSLIHISEPTRPY